MTALREPLLRAAASASPILIVGPPGSGRSSLARALHLASSRATGPMVEVDPSTVPPTLFESELFGHRPGAFTGADAARAGRVERASGGTLLFDHVEELPLAVQPKLLRLLAEGRFAPLGGVDQDADVRVLATTAPGIGENVRRGRFREDLYYRLEVLAFNLAPLRERAGDLKPLVSALLQDLCERYGLEPVGLDDASREWMRRHAWPGNARELRNVLERALILHEGGTLSVPEPAEARPSAPRSLEEVEREAVIAALEHTRGHQGRAAEILGISRKALWEKRRRLGLP